MPSETKNLECPGCGAPVSTSQQNCDFCKGPIIISTFTSVASIGLPLLQKYASSYGDALSRAPGDPQLCTSAAMCYLKLRLYDKALIAFEKAIEANFDNSEIYFYAVVCLFNGQRPFLSDRATIDRALSLLRAGTAIEARAIYLYYDAFIRYDYFERKFFRIEPGFRNSLARSREIGLSEHDVNELHDLICVARPPALK
jgi:tetratricopeptide (TPR) repeat protein